MALGIGGTAAAAGRLRLLRLGDYILIRNPTRR